MSETAKTILTQLGGNQFIIMTGAKNLAYGNNSLSFSIGKNSGKANKVNVELNSNDTYTMDFYSMRGSSINLKKSYADIYCDQLAELFTKFTGMHTKLF